LTNTYLNVYRPNRLSIIQNASRGISESSCVSVLKKGRKTKGGENSKKIWMRDAVVGFRLVEKDQPPVNGVLSCITQNIAQGHGNVSGLSSLDETSLVMSNQIWKNVSQTRGEEAREDLAVAIGQRDRVPVRQAREVTVRFGDERDDCSGPGRRRRCTSENGVEKGKKNRYELFCEGLIPLIRKAIRAGGSAWRQSTDGVKQFVSCKGREKKGEVGRGKVRKRKGREKGSNRRRRRRHRTQSSEI